MRRYETFVIIDPDLPQDQRDQVIQRVEELISQMDGFLVLRDDWGERKLAYDIKKRSRGYYVRFDYAGLSPLVDEIERFFRIDDRALKYMTVLLDKAVDLEKIKIEQAEAASKAAIEAAQAEAAQEVKTAPVEDAAPVKEAAPAEDAAAVEDTAPVEDAAPVEDTAPVAEKPQEDVAPSSDESDSASNTTPLKNPEEA
ncbi:MAG: 30S ribosomal protein S6 [Desulfobacteraceae bacterium]|jgi:small subunit ribosomal protein S6|nr:30S ribosomal protein S6 [Desulfobacteraceae bacterium]